ncbi:FemAB family protein [Saccharicrinis carchari]|uniref:FemAB family protein n=1 Tax=Saccharicrinis carchari TaxID=1168039 RepID=A0A521BTM6_SACCC|nr:peptidoglycan bridge formation glycyltransferase FemA/FemB family protein [Saccharicrinis carchari]SMO50509.1 FemAB family protein [Saccharicrinis carchari]
MNNIHISIHPLNKIDEGEWISFLNKNSESTFFCTLDWWKTFEHAFILQLRNDEGILLGGVPFRILSVMPLAQKYFQSAWLDSSVLVHDGVEEGQKLKLKKKAIEFLLVYLKKMHVINMTISSKTRSYDAELFKEVFGESEKCATFIVDLNKNEEAIFRAFSKGRKSAVKKAEKMGVEVKILKGESGFALIPDYCFLENKLFANKRQSYSNIYFKSEGYLKTLLSSDNTYVAMAYYNDKPVAGSIIVAHQKSLYYYLGASDIELNRVTNASSLLMYENIKFGKEKGYQAFDMGGIPIKEPDMSDSLYGVYKFKKDFGGERQAYHCAGYTLHPGRYHFLWKLRKYESNRLAQRAYKMLKGSKGI